MNTAQAHAMDITPINRQCGDTPSSPSSYVSVPGTPQRVSSISSIAPSPEAAVRSPEREPSNTSSTSLPETTAKTPQRNVSAESSTQSLNQRSQSSENQRLSVTRSSPDQPSRRRSYSVSFDPSMSSNETSELSQKKSAMKVRDDSGVSFDPSRIIK